MATSGPQSLNCVHHLRDDRTGWADSTRIHTTEDDLYSAVQDNDSSRPSSTACTSCCVPSGVSLDLPYWSRGSRGLVSAVTCIATHPLYPHVKLSTTRGASSACASPRRACSRIRLPKEVRSPKTRNLYSCGVRIFHDLLCPAATMVGVHTSAGICLRPRF